MISSKTRQKLQEKSNEYYTRLQVIEAKAHQLLEFSQGGSHITFTPHGLSHISAVERNYDWLLPDADLDGFNACEIFCLLCATFFHDAFMIPTRVGDEVAARENHTQRAHDFLQKYSDSLGISLHEAEAISQIIYAHAVYDFDEIDERIVIGSEILDLRKLGACLALADISHADSSRAPKIVFTHLDLNEESAFHWRRHLQISGITRKGETLIMSALTFSEHGREAVEDYKKSIERQLEIVRPYFDTVLEPINRRVELIQKRLESPLDQTLQFQTNTPAILKLLIEGVYDREDVFIRELVQNSLDSCLLHKAKQNRRNARYDPQILITLLTENDNLRALRIDDNGVGMDIGDVQDTVLWIGNSISSREDLNVLLQKELGRNLIATFGIGLLSCFKASNSITVRTQKENETALEFKLTGVSDNIKPEKATDTSIGTTIIIEISKEKAEFIDPLDTIDYYFRMVNQVSLKTLELDWDPEFIKSPREELFRIARTEAAPVDDDNYPTGQNYLSTPIQGDDYSGSIWLPKTDLDVIDLNGNIDILNEGIFVTRDPITEWFPDFLYFCEGVLNFSSKSITLPAGRDRVIRDEKFKSKVNEIKEKSYFFVDRLVHQTKTTKVNRRFPALILSKIFEKANLECRNRILRHMDEYAVEKYKTEGRITLKELQNYSTETIYIQYPIGRWVTELSVVDGKQLYHKEDDFVDLQAAIFTQEGHIVLSTERYDEGGHSKGNAVLEANLVAAYLDEKNIHFVDLTEDNVLEGRQRSKPIPTSIRQELGAQTKFVEVTGLPNKKSWKVGNELWINLANPSMRRIYNVLQEDSLDEDNLKHVLTLFNLLGHKYDEAIYNITEWIGR